MCIWFSLQSSHKYRFLFQRVMEIIFTSVSTRRYEQNCATIWTVFHLGDYMNTAPRVMYDIFQHGYLCHTIAPICMLHVHMAVQGRGCHNKIMYILIYRILKKLKCKFHRCTYYYVIMERINYSTLRLHENMSGVAWCLRDTSRMNAAIPNLLA